MKNLWMPLGLMLLGLVACQPETNQTEPDPSTRSAADSLNLSPDSLQSPAEQLAYLNRQLALAPEDYTLYEQRSQVYYGLDSLGAARADIATAIGKFPQNPQLHYLKGFYALQAGDTATGWEALETAVGLGSKNPEAYYQMGQVRFMQEKPAAARQWYEKARELDDREPLYVFAEGLLEEKLGREREAGRLYRRSLELDSTFAKALVRLHDLYLTFYENETEAMKYNEQLLRHHPGHPLGRLYAGNYEFRRAMRFTREEDLPRFREAINEAVMHYTISLNRDPDFTQAYYNRGLCYFMGDESRIQQAVEDFEHTLEMDPDYAPAHFNLGSIYEKNGDLISALRAYERALELQPSNEDFQLAVKEVKARLR